MESTQHKNAHLPLPLPVRNFFLIPAALTSDTARAHLYDRNAKEASLDRQLCATVLAAPAQAADHLPKKNEHVSDEEPPKIFQTRPRTPH